MSPAVKAALAGLAVAFVVAVGLNFLFASMGAGDLGSSGWVLPMVLGTFVATTMYRLSSNQAEEKVKGGDREAMLSLTPPPGAGLLVVMREGFAGKAVGLDLTVDGRPAAQLRSPRATVLRVAPGEHDVTVTNAQGTGKGSSETIRVPVAAGEVAFVELRFAMGMTDGIVKLSRPADPARARATVAKLTLVAPEPEWSTARAA